MKKILSTILTLSIMFSMALSFNITASAASVTYYETSEDNVPLRNAKGSENTTVSKISKKGTVVKLIKTEINWTTFVTWTNWHKVQVASKTTNNGLYGDYWLWNGNVNKHKHSLSAGACTSTGCDYVETIETIDNEKMTMEVKEKTSAVRKAPYNDGEMVADLKKGDLVSVTNKVKNYKGSYWYKLSSGDYIYSGNVKKAPATTVGPATNSVNNSGGSSSGGNSSGGSSSSGSSTGANSGFFTPPQTIALPCSHINWSVGKCVNCGRAWELREIPISGTYAASKDGVVVRDIPYKQGKQIRTLNKGDTVKIVAKATNSANHIWYKTNDGYWVYEVGQVKLKRAYFSKSGHTFYNLTETVTPKVIYEPSNAAVTKTWKISSGKDFVSLDTSSGKITPKKAGKATVVCTVKGDDGTSFELEFNVVIDEIVNLETWSYDNQKYNQDLALECVEYSALAYPENGCVSYTKKPIILNSREKSTEPIGLTKLLKERGFNYQVSNTYYNPLETTSPYTLASKKVNYNGVPKDIVYVIIEGSAGLEGWQGNMKMASNGDYYNELDYHYTFNEAALGKNGIKKGLDSYINDNKLSKPIVVITGHSRGAASGNLLAANITNDTNYEKVYAYLFATPNTTKTPNRNLKNIINICNELDFVAYIPFSSNDWEFEKHGVTYSFNSKNSYNANPLFADTIDYEYGKPDYVWNAKTPKGIRSYTVGIWKETEDYYKHKSTIYSKATCNCNEEAFKYFYEGLAKAAVGFNDTSVMFEGAVHMVGHLLHDNCPFEELTWFFLKNGSVGEMTAFKACHTVETYHAAIYAKTSLYTNVELFSTETYGNGSVEINPDEYDALYSFFSQSENELMLEVAGWDIEDASTWEGIKWNTDGNVVSIDLSYLNLSGWFNANNFPELQNLNVDGNSLTMLVVSECDNLVNLSCMSNNLSNLSVNNCSNLQSLDCGFNQINGLNLSNMSQLTNLNCYGNAIASINLNGATALETVRCGNNELSTIDISTNNSLSVFYCDNNNIVEAQNPELMNKINAINLNGGSAILGTQKYNDNYGFNEAELTCLTEFAGMSLNQEKLGWDMEIPYTWQGVEWQIKGNEYHITSINFDGLELEGDFNLPEAEYVESVSMQNSSLSTMNLSGCSNLSALNCYNSGISDLVIDDCTSLESIDCESNNLEVEKVESSLNQIGLNGSMATYANQNINADETEFNINEREELISLLSTGSNYEALGWDWNWPGTWDGIVWTKADGEYRVSSIDFSDKAICGSLDLSGFEYLDDFNFSGTQIDSVILPDCIVKIPEYAFYNSDIKYIHMSEGVTNIEKAAFAYCDNLNTVVLPTTVTKILDNAFYESANLKNLIFIGDEPLVVGTDVAYGTSPEFNIIFFADSVWNGTTELLNDYSYIIKKDDYIALLDENIELKDDAYYSETNNYAGDDVNVTIVSKTPGASATCLLSVYDELGRFKELSSVPIEMNRYMTVATFEDINIQYAGEEYCTLKTFLWSNLDSLKPLTTTAEKVLIKPVAE